MMVNSIPDLAQKKLPHICPEYYQHGISIWSNIPDFFCMNDREKLLLVNRV
jgi:hypothetical protein